MELIWIIVGIIAIILAVKVAALIIKGALKLTVIAGVLALLFYLATHVNILSLLR